MSDESLRAAERGGDGLVEGARLLVERVRAGTFPVERLRLLESIGDPHARVAAGLDPLPEGVEDVAMLAFEERLAEAIVWCTERLALGLSRRQVLRSRELRPEKFGREEQLHVRSEWVAASEHVARVRRERLAERGWLDGTRARGLAGGRLLVHDPRLQLFHRAAVEASEELFDVDFLPPWDSWVAWAGATSDEAAWSVFDGYLVSWVPGELVESVEKVIGVSPSETIRWAGQLKDGFAAKLEVRGLLG